jgi:hypothetical protein
MFEIHIMQTLSLVFHNKLKDFIIHHTKLEKEINNFFHKIKFLLFFVGSIHAEIKIGYLDDFKEISLFIFKPK